MSRAVRNYHVFESAMGFCAIAWSERGVVRFQLPTKTAEAADRLMRRRAKGAEPARPRRTLRRSLRPRRDTSTARRRTSRTSGSTSRKRTHSSPGFTSPCVGSVGAARPLMAHWRRRSARAVRPRATSATRWPKIRRRSSFRVTGFWPPAARSAASRRPAVRGRSSACSNWRAFGSGRRKRRSVHSVSERNTARDPSVPLWRIAGARSCLRLAPFELRKPGVVAIKRDPGTRARLQERRTMRRRRAAH